jgi:Flp pilus assembly protein TadG
MTKLPSLLRQQQGSAMVEVAFGLPAFIMLVWLVVQLGLIYRANSGIQHALGQGARYATLYPTPTDTLIEARMDSAVYGIGPGTFTTTVTPNTTDGYRDLLVTYTQTTSLLLLPGPNISISKQKRVWVAGT